MLSNACFTAALSRTRIAVSMPSMTRSPAATCSGGPRASHARVCQSVNDVGEPCAGEPHARFDAAAGGNPGPVGHAARSSDASRRPYHQARHEPVEVAGKLLLQAGGRLKGEAVALWLLGRRSGSQDRAPESSASTGSLAGSLQARRSARSPYPREAGCSWVASKGRRDTNVRLGSTAPDVCLDDLRGLHPRLRASYPGSCRG